MDPSWLIFALLGRPDFQSRGSKILIFKGFWGLWTENRGAHKRENQPRRIQPPILGPLIEFAQKNSRRVWRSRGRKSSSVPEGAVNFPAAVFLAGKCPNLGRDSIACCRKIREEFSSSVEICRKTFPARNFRQPQPSRVF